MPSGYCVKCGRMSHQHRIPAVAEACRDTPWVELPPKILKERFRAMPKRKFKAMRAKLDEDGIRSRNKELDFFYGQCREQQLLIHLGVRAAGLMRYVPMDDPDLAMFTSAMTCETVGLACIPFAIRVDGDGRKPDYCLGFAAAPWVIDVLTEILPRKGLVWEAMLGCILGYSAEHIQQYMNGMGGRSGWQNAHDEGMAMLRSRPTDKRVEGQTT